MSAAVKQPGARGGVGFYDDRGVWQYGARPVPREPRNDFERHIAGLKAESHAKREKIAPALRHYEEHGGAVELEHRIGDRTTVSVLSKRPTAAGGHRITSFDEDGPSGHSEHDTFADAVKRIHEEGTLTGAVNQGHLDRWVGTERWNTGLARTAHVRKWADIRAKWQHDNWHLFDTDKPAWHAAAEKLRTDEDADFERTLRDFTKSRVLLILRGRLPASRYTVMTPDDFLAGWETSPL